MYVQCKRGWVFDFKPLRVVAKVDEEVKVEQARLCMILNLWRESLFAFTDGENCLLLQMEREGELKEEEEGIVETVRFVCRLEWGE